ncbi:MAG TPA: hypothetical protein VK842_07835, partial [bacterium]|nr:hypothetical protein [bacterium]
MKLTAYPWANFWLLATMLLIAGHAFFLWRRKRFFLFDPLMTFWGGFLICNIMQPLSYSDIFVNWHSVDNFNLSCFYSFLGVVCVVWGYEMDLGQRIGYRIPHVTRKLDPDRFFVAAIILSALGISCYYFLFQSAGGMWEWLSYGRGGTDYDKVNGYIREMEKLTPIGIYLLILHVTMHPVSRLRKILSWGFVALLWLWYLYLGTRSRIIGVGMLAAAAYYVPKYKNPNLLLVLPGFIVMIILTNFQAHYRGNFTNLSFNLDKIDMDEAKALCLPGFLGGDKELQRKQASQGIDFNVLMATVELVPDKVDYNYGWGFMEFVTRPIPKALWPNKIYPGLESWQGVLREGGLSTAQVADRDLVMGPAFNFAAFWYYIFGPLAVILGGLYTGLLFRCIRTYLDRDIFSEGNVVIYNT